MSSRAAIARSLAALAAIGLSFYAAAASAEPTAAEVAVARKLFREANELQSKGAWDEAARKLRDAIAIKDTPGLRFHLAFTEAQRGRLVEALVEYDRAEELLRSGQPAPDLADKVEPAREALQRRVPTLEIQVPAELTGARLEIDGQAVAPQLMSHPVPLNPGRHRVEVSAAGHRPFQADVELTEGERRVMLAVLPLADQRPATPHEETAASRDWRPSTRTYVLLGESAVALSGFAVGAGYLWSASSHKERGDELRRSIAVILPGDAACTNPAEGSELAAQCRELLAERTAERSARNIAVTGFVVGGVGVAALVGTWLLWPAESTEGAALTVRVGDGFYAGISGRY